MGDVDAVTALAMTRAGHTREPGTLPVSEVFGPVWQGEGPHAGRVCWFVRLGLCNLHCTWCDTPYTWDHGRFNVAAECPPMHGKALTELLLDAQPPIVVLSGGEPLIHQRNPALLDSMASVTAETGARWHVETNGTLTPAPALVDRVEHFTVSPKINPQGDPHARRIRPDALAAFTNLADEGRAAFKIVCATPADVDTAAAFYEQHDMPDDARWIMPEGVTADTVLTHAHAIAETALRHGLNLTLRQHTLMYGTERQR